MGDIMTLVEQAQEKMDLEASEKSAKRMMNGQFTLEEMCIRDRSNTYPGTSWEMVSVGKVPVGVNVNDADFNSVGKTGGAKSVTLSVDQIPSHEHVGVYYHDGRAISFRCV